MNRSFSIFSVRAHSYALFILQIHKIFAYYKRRVIIILFFLIKFKFSIQGEEKPTTTEVEYKITQRTMKIALL